MNQFTVRHPLDTIASPPQQRQAAIPDWKKPVKKTIHALVTGASGFIGSHLVQRLLQDGKRVRLFRHHTPCRDDFNRDGVEVVSGDLDDIETLTAAVEGVEVVYHLAGRTSADDEETMRHVNGVGSRNVARACAAQQEPPVLLYVSSIAATGPVLRGALRGERDAPQPISRYGRSKLAGEIAMADYASDVPITIVRPAIVFGPRNLETLPVFRTIRWLHVHPILGWQAPVLSLIYIDDLIEILLRAAEKGTRLPPSNHDPLRQLTFGSGVYFASAPEHPDYAEFGRIVRGLLHCPRAPVIYLPGPLPWLAAGLFEMFCRLRGRSSSVNRDKLLEASAASWACSGELASRELGYAFPQSLAERLKLTVDWYREQRWL